MFKTLEIKNLRGVKFARIDGLSQINLFFGKNNCGKSTVLEALFLISGQSNPTLPLSINSMRNYSKFAESDLNTEFYNLNPENKISISTTGYERRHLEMAAGPRVYVHRYMYNGKELDRMHGLDWYDYGARHYDAAIGKWHSMDDICYAYYDISPYAYCGGDPVNAIDLDGRSTWMTNQGNGIYQVIGGDINDKDLNIYVYEQDDNGEYTVRGKSIGQTTSMTSFYDSDYNNGEGKWMDKSVIDSKDGSGLQFMYNLISDDPSLLDYIGKTQNGHEYDFKATNGNPEENYSLNHYRGMPFGVSKAGYPIFTSARDIGNIAAGYVSARKNLPWKIARLGFDGYQILQSGKFNAEGNSTQSAQKYGYELYKRGFQ